MTNPSNPSIAQSFKPGDKLAGCYTLKELQPPHGFCTVWLAHDEELGKDIVLHFVPDSVRADTRAMSELKAEAKRNRQLVHPRIVRVHDLVEDEKWAAISMDKPGGDTYEAVQQNRGSHAFDPSELAPAISELCQTLEDAHRIDLIHRDLTPSNLISTDNGLMVQKFGISRVILDSLARAGQKTEASRDIAYMSPQQLDAERPSRADDVYSLGATVYDLLTGAPPFYTGDIISQVRKTVPKPVSECRHAQKIAGESIPKEWDAVIAACLAKNFEERPKSAADAGARFAAGKAAAPAAAPATTPTAAPAIEAAAGGVAAASAPETPKPESTPPSPGGAEPKSATPEQEAAPKQQKRPWTPGPGKAPLITEATVLSTTPVPKGEQKGDQKPDETKQEGTDKPAESATAGAATGPKKPGPTTPSGFPLSAILEVDGDKRPKPKSNAGIFAAAAVLILVVILALIVYNRNNSSSSAPSESAAVTTGTNAVPSPANLEGSPSPAEVAATSPSPSPTAVTTVAAVSPSPAAEAAASPAPEAPTAEATAPPSTAVAESPAPSAAEIGAMTDAQAQQLLSDKAKAVDQAKAALAAAQTDAQAKASAQTQAAAAVQQVQATAKDKADAADAAKKAADDAAAKLTQQQADLQKAQADADDAAKAAAAKAQAAAQLQKTVQDAQAAVQQQQTAAQQAQDDAAKVAQSVADTQKAADDAAKAAADAEKLRQEQDQSLTQAQAELTQIQNNIDQVRNSEKAKEAAAAAAEAARIQKQREAETARLTAQAAAAAKAAEDAQKALEVAKKAVADAEKAQADAEAQAAAAAASGTAPLPETSPAPEASPSPESSPAATPPTNAETTPTPAPAPGSPTLSVTAPNPKLRVDQALSNSLGMRFAPVGKVFFSIWLTRVQDFAAFAKATGYTGSAWQNPGFKQAPDHPVVNVSWNDANQFCLWLTEKEHQMGILDPAQEYRLPTDLEWSNGVGLPPESGRSPESRDMDVPDVYPWGTQWPPPAGAGNYTGEETDSDVAIKGYNDGFAWTSPVGSFNADKFGLYDMGGNVWEWCGDWWNSEQKQKVLRGGSWYNGALRLSLLSSCRIHAAADEGTDNYGFRIVLAKEESKGKSRRNAQ